MRKLERLAAKHLMEPSLQQAAGMTGWGTLAVLSGVVVGTQLWNGNESASADEEWKKVR